MTRKLRIQQVSEDPLKQASRTKSVPEKLGKLLEAVNGLPPNPKRFEYRSIVDQEYMKFREEVSNYIKPDDRGQLRIAWAMDPKKWEQIRKNKVSEFVDFINSLPASTREFIGETDKDKDYSFDLANASLFSSEKRLNEAHIRYEFLLKALEVLRAIARRNQHQRPPPFELFAAAALEINEFGKIAVSSNTLIDALTDKKVEANRIRECPICNHIFWAGRIDQPACSKRCGHILRSRKWRKSYEKKYKNQRITKPKEPISRQKQSSKKGAN